MKTLTLLLFALLLALNSYAQDHFPILREAHCDTVTQGETCFGYFVFRNESKSAVRISNVNASTSNFAPENYPIEPIQPGDTARVAYKFVTDGKGGHYEKPIRVTFTNDTTFYFTVRFYIILKQGIANAPVMLNTGQL